MSWCQPPPLKPSLARDTYRRFWLLFIEWTREYKYDDWCYCVAQLEQLEREALTMTLPNHGMPVPLANAWQASFLSPLVATPLDDGKHWRLDEGFVYETLAIPSSYGATILTLPAGFITDFASVPRPLWSLVGAPTGWYSKAAALHDYCFDTPGIATFAQANNVFLEAMTLAGKHSAWQRWALYHGVSLFGRSSYTGGLR